jgi:hypothetical protein
MTGVRRKKDMAKEPGKNRLTDTQKQVRQRGRRGPARTHYGFLAKTSPSGAWAAMTLRQMEGALSSLLTEYAEWEKEVVYAELLEYARLVTRKYEKAFAPVRMIEQAEREKQAPRNNW